MTIAFFSASDLTISGYNNAVENYGGIVIFNNVKFEENHMDYRIDRDWGAAILNGATCICNRCTFIKNECQNVGAIFNQGQLSLNNCTFKDNKAYSHGNDVLNADKGQVYVNGELINGSSGCVEYVKSIKTFGQVLIGILGTLGSITVGMVEAYFH